MRYITLFVLLVCMQLSAEGPPEKVYDVHNNCYPRAYAKYENCYPFVDMEKYECSYEYLKYCMQKGFTHLEKGEYLDAVLQFNHVCFTLVPKHKNIIVETKEFSDEVLYLFCDALQGRLACAYHLGTAGDVRHSEEREILQKIDKRIPKYNDYEKCYVLDLDFDEDELKEFTENLKGMQLIDKSSDVVKMPNGSVKFKVKDAPCCDSCEDGGDCEKKSLK